MPDGCQWCGDGPCPYPEGSCPPVVVLGPSPPDLYDPDLAAQIRAHEAREQEIIRAGEDMLEARWSSPLTPGDAYDLANVEVRTNPTTDELGAQYVEIVGADTPMQETIEETLTPLEQEVEDSRDRDDDGRPGADS